MVHNVGKNYFPVYIAGNVKGGGLLSILVVSPYIQGSHRFGSFSKILANTE